MIRIIILWCAICSLTLSYGVDTIVIHQVNSNYQITGRIPRFSSQDKDNDFLTSFLKEINDDIDYEFSEIKGQVISEALQFSSDFPNSNLLPFTMNSSYTLTSNSDTTLFSVLIEASYYTGGAHPNYYYKGYTLDESRPYELDDFFMDPGGARRYITDSIKNAIHRNIERSKKGLEVKKYFDAVEIDLDRSTYYIVEDNIVILFPHYTLGPYSSGALEFRFTLKELSPFLHRRWTEI